MTTAELESALRGISKRDNKLADEMRKLEGLRLATANSVLSFLEPVANRGYHPGNLANVLRAGLESKAITHQALVSMLPILKEIADSGHNSATVAYQLSEAMRAGRFTHKELPAIGDILTAASKADYRPEIIAPKIVSGLESGAITSRNLPAITEHLQANAKKHNPGHLLDHAFMAKKELGIPLSQVLALQNRFIREGHFPTAGSVIEFHRRFHK